MTRTAREGDRGLQAERTVLAWTRTSMAVLASGVLVVLKDRNVADLAKHPAQIVVGGAASAIALAVFTLGARRRRTLTTRPLPRRLAARPAVIAAGVSVMGLTALVVGYLLLPLV